MPAAELTDPGHQELHRPSPQHLSAPPPPATSGVPASVLRAKSGPLEALGIYVQVFSCRYYLESD